MKSKKFEKKLVLNKKTIVNLGNNELGNVKGGDQGSAIWSNCCQFNSWAVNDQTECIG